MDNQSTYGIKVAEIPHQITAKYIIRKEIGKGAYGTVYLAMNKKTGEEVAIKRINDVFRTRIDAKRALREITILRQCNHPNIAKLIDLVVPSDIQTYRSLWMVQEYGGWDLSKIVKSSQHLSGWSDVHVQSILYQLLCGLFYLQSGNLVHRDLKPSNILINDKDQVKIIDFGLARQMHIQYHEEKETAMDVGNAGIQMTGKPAMERQLTQHVVTRWYRAPELILMQEYYNAEIDMWAVGCIFAELLQTLEPGIRSQPLFPGKSCFPLSAKRAEREQKERFEEEFRAETHQLMKIFEVIGTPSEEDIAGLDDGPMKDYLSSLDPIDSIDFGYLFPSASPAAIKLLKRMLVFNPKKRITVKQALQSDYLKGVRKPESEIQMHEKISFPFEYHSGNTEMEAYRLRRLIFHETVEFNKVKEKESSSKERRLRSTTMSEVSRPRHHRTHSEVKSSIQDKDKNCCIV